MHIHSRLTRAEDDFRGMLARLDTGLLVTAMLGDGVNLLTGDFSRGASGFWVQGGIVQHPVEGITVAGRLQDMFCHIAAIGADSIVRGNGSSGSILIEEMTVAGGSV